MILANHAVRLCPQADNDVPQNAVVHVLATLPNDPARVDPKFISLLDMIVKERRQQIIRGSNRMKISCKMKVQILHRYNLRVSAARCAAFDAKTWSK